MTFRPEHCRCFKKEKEKKKKKKNNRTLITGIKSVVS